MKKILIIIIFFMIIISIFFVVNYKNYQLKQKQVSEFNSDYEYYKKDDLNGLDITTLINKAISNNEKFAVPKDENGLYILDDENSIEIYITMIINNTTYRMEKINQLDINAFIRYFGEIGFKCTDVQYHKKSGKIASMTFEAKEY